jgi:hypothetical protein
MMPVKGGGGFPVHADEDELKAKIERQVAELSGDGVPASLQKMRTSVDCPDRDLNRLTTALRIFAVIPIAIVLGSVGGYGASWSTGSPAATTVAVGGSGLLFLPPLLMIVFRQKYPRWWFDWNLELLRFANRVGVYLPLMDDRYPSTDEQQSVHLELGYPDARAGLNRWLAIARWLLAIPHYIALLFPLRRRALCRDRRLVRDPVRRPVPARDLRLHRGRDPLAQPGRRLRLGPRDRRVRAVSTGTMTPETCSRAPYAARMLLLHGVWACFFRSAMFRTMSTEP